MDSFKNIARSNREKVDSKRNSDHLSGSSQTYFHKEIPYHRKQTLEFTDFTHILVVPKPTMSASIQLHTTSGHPDHDTWPLQAPQCISLQWPVVPAELRPLEHGKIVKGCKRFISFSAGLGPPAETPNFGADSMKLGAFKPKN